MRSSEQATRDLRAMLIEDLEQIEDNVGLYKDARNSAYQAVAVQLRALFFDQKYGGGLLLRVLPDATLHPILDDSHDDDYRKSIIIFGHAVFQPAWRGQRASITIPFDEGSAPIEIPAWLNQWVIVPTVKIRALIGSIANEEVAHTNSERSKVLAELAGSVTFSMPQGDFEAGRFDRMHDAQETYRMVIVSIGEYVARRARELLG